MAGALALIVNSPGILGFKGPTSAAAAPAWELVGAIRVAKDMGLNLDSTLTLDGIADTEKAVAVHAFETIDTLLWGADAALPTTTIMRKAEEIKGRWIRMVLYHPVLYARTKLRIYRCMIGLCPEYLQMQVRAIEPWPQLKGNVSVYKAVGTSAELMKIANWTGEYLRFLMVPAFWLPLSMLALGVSWKSYSGYDKMLIWMAGAYLASFFILNQAASFRYLFPTYVVFTAYQVRAIGARIGWLAQRAARQ